MELFQMRRFTDEGIDQARIWLANSRQALDSSDTRGMLESTLLTEAKGRPISKEIFGPSAFKDKLALAKALEEAVVASGLNERDFEDDRGFWTWMSINFFKFLVSSKGGVGEDALWIYDPANWRKVYRHKMAPLWLVYRAHKDNPSRLNGVLGISVNKTGEVYEQMMSRKWIVLSPGIMALVTNLYFDEKGKGLKKGSGGKDEGAARRLSTVLDQLRLTYDIEQLNSEVLSRMLPNDFHKFIR